MRTSIYTDTQLNMAPTQLFKCLADETRLTCMLLIQQVGEACVCDLVEVLELSQPKVSRHLAQLRNCGLLLDRRQGQWVYYSLAPGLPGWMTAIMAEALAAEAKRVEPLVNKLGLLVSRETCC